MISRAFVLSLRYVHAQPCTCCFHDDAFPYFDPTSSLHLQCYISQGDKEKLFQQKREGAYADWVKLFAGTRQRIQGIGLQA